MLQSEQKKREQLNTEQQQQQLKVQLNAGQQKRQQLAKQKEDLKNPLDTQNGAMMQNNGEADKAKSDLYAKEQQKAQLESQRDQRTDGIERIKIQTNENEQKLNENERNMVQTMEARCEREIVKQNDKHKVNESE